MAALAIVAIAARGHDSGSATKEILLRDGWQVQSSAKVKVAGDAISQPGFDASAWYKTSVPKTVFAVLVENGVYKDPYFGMNLRAVPGVSYKIGSQFSNQEMPRDSPYAVPWWYRTEFAIPASYGRKRIWIAFSGINYRANIWINGRKLAGLEEIAGAFRRYEFDVTSFVKGHVTNALAVEVFAPHPEDLGITFVDWNPTPPDKDMGLWQEVALSASGPVTLRHSFVETRLNLPEATEARLTVHAELHNVSDVPVCGVLHSKIAGSASGIDSLQKVELAAGETRSVVIPPETARALTLKNPRLWWPYQMGEPYLYKLTLQFITDAKEVSDTEAIDFGIAQTDSELTPEGNRLLKVNGKPVLVRGAGWTPDMMLRADEPRREAEFRYVKEMGLNTLRLEGKMEDESFFERADREGILVMAGWCCCDAWEKWGKWNKEAKSVSVESLRDQLLRLRRHPSVLVWLNGSDNPPPKERERAYLDVEKEVHWPKPVLSSASEKKTEATGASGVKMSGPYDYVPPNYWLLATKVGGAFGFNTETSPGPAVPPLEELKAMFPAEKVWPINEVWDFHSGGGYFKNIGIFMRALEARYGKAKDAEDFSWKAQAMAYEGERAMFEAYGRNKYKSTGVIQWMLNNAWPGLIWHLYDYHLRPAGGYFGTKKALEPVHVQFSYDYRTVAVVNGKQEAQAGLKVVAKVYDLSMQVQFSREETVSVAADGVATAFAVPESPHLSTTYFLRLRVFSASGELLSRNFYWLSTQPDVLDFNKTEWYYTPESSYADFTALQQLAKTPLKVTMQWEAKNSTGRLALVNMGSNLAFQVRLRLLKKESNEEILPVYWEDNYLSLLPGEKREISVRLRKSDVGTTQPILAVDGMNVGAVAQ